MPQRNKTLRIGQRTVLPHHGKCAFLLAAHIVERIIITSANDQIANSFSRCITNYRAVVAPLIQVMRV